MGLAATIVLTVGISASRGEVHSGSAALFPDTALTDPGWRIETWVPFGGGAYLLVSIEYDQVTSPNHAVLHAETYTVGVGHRWYESWQGCWFDAPYAASTVPFASNHGDYFEGSMQIMPFQPFYLAYALGEIEERSEFGWAMFMYDMDDLLLLDSAQEDQGVGIIVGTTTALPEPSTIGMLLAALALLIRKTVGFRQRRV